MKLYYIYMTTHLTNGKRYIGQHYGELNDKYYGSGIIITKIINKEGTKNLLKEILYICHSREEADQKEKEFINKFDAVNSPDFYNLQEGGTGGDGFRACRRWMKQNPEKATKIYQENYQRLQNWIKEHPQEFQERVVKPMLEGSKKWRETHPQEMLKHMEVVNQAKIKWQQAHQEEHARQVKQWIYFGSEANKKRIKCITTGEEFESLSAAERAYSQYGVRQANLSKVLKGERHSCGKINGQKLQWAFVD